MPKPIMQKISRFIVEKRAFIFLFFLAAVLFCIFSVGRVRINSDLAALLPADTVTRRGITIMEKEFESFATADIMVSNITYERAEAINQILTETDHVSTVLFDDTSDHYASSAALYNVTFSGADNDPEIIDSLSKIKEELKGYEVSISSTIGIDFVGEIAGEMGMILLCAVIVIIGVMLFTSKSYFEILIMLIVFAVAALLNMGTNFWLGEISSITNSIAVILQLALAIDYAIIFCHRFQNEYEKQKKVKSSLIDSLAFSIIEIASSSLTTIAGLVALTLMQFRLGYDLGLVLIKGIVCSILTVFLLMPGLIMVFHKPLLKTRHKSFVPDVTGWGRILAKKVPVFLIIFALLLPFSIYASSICEYSFADSATDRITWSERDLIDLKIRETFDETNMVVLLVPRGDYEKEKTLLKEIEALPKVKTASGLSNFEITDQKTLTDPFSARSFSELIGVDIETAELLYALYGYEHQQFQPILGDREHFEIPLLDVLEFLFDASDRGIISLDAEQSEQLQEMRDMLDKAVGQLRGENYVRMLFEAEIPAQGEESYALIGQVTDMAKELYGEDVLVIGDVTSAMDLENSFRSDNRLVSFLTILFIFLILVAAFKSIGGAVMLILVIQGSIWLNFSFPLIMGQNVFFLAYLIVSAIQMGATIDYAIVIYNRFQFHKALCPVREAMARAVNESFATVLTSGTIMTAAGFLIGYMTSDLYVASVGLALGRGTLISVILVLTVLPQLLILGNRIAEKTTFNLKKLMGGDADA